MGYLYTQVPSLKQFRLSVFNIDYRHFLENRCKWTRPEIISGVGMSHFYLLHFQTHLCEQSEGVATGFLVPPVIANLYLLFVESNAFALDILIIRLCHNTEND